MTRHSLRLRLALAQAAALAVALALAGLGLTLLFERHLERRVDAELATYLRQLAGQLAFAPDGSASLDASLADPRFSIPLGGLYWQVEVSPDGSLLRSRSLWDTVLELPPDPLEPGVVHRHELPGPGGATLVLQERLILVATPSGERRARLAAAVDRRTLDAALAEYRGQLTLGLGGLAAVLSLAAVVQVWFGLRPFEQLRVAVGAVRERRARRLEGRFPDEIQPLVAEVDALLAAQEAAIGAARQRAGDLAHGLKTPLTVLRAEARRLAAAGDAATAAELDRLAAAMQRHVDRELARTRLAGAGSAAHATALAPIVARLVRTLERTPAGAALAWQIEVPADLAVAVDADDLAELLGTLLDNAGKWARSEVGVAATGADGAVRLTIDDDGPGVAAGARERLGSRGLRLDAATPGHGIGLAIARDIAEAYAATLDFAASEAGGLRVTLGLPAARAKGSGGR